MSSRPDAIQDSLKMLARDSKEADEMLDCFSHSVHSAALLAKFTDLVIYSRLNKNPLFLQMQFKTPVGNMSLRV